MLFISEETVKGSLTVAPLILLAISPGSLTACSMAGCLDNGVELRPDFVIKITHDDRPLSRVTVQITRNAEGNSYSLFSGETAADGTVHISKFPPGNYWLNAELLGIVAGSECFHVSLHSSRKAKKNVNFEWGDLAPATRQAAGRLTNSQRGQGGTPTWNVTHLVNVPISNAKLTLRTALADAVYSTVSDDDGRFTFNEIPDGLYVLHVEGGATPGGTTFKPANLLFRLSGTANPKVIAVTEYDPVGGSCGGWSLEPDYAQN